MKLIAIEFRRISSDIKAYFADYIVGFILSFFMLFFVLDRAQDINTSYFAYISWILASSVLGEASRFIAYEKHKGTLQNLMITPYGILPISLAKSFVWFCFNLGKVILISFLLPNIEGLYFDSRLIFILLLQFIGILGAALVLAALTLANTKVASFETLLSFFLFYLSGSMMAVPNSYLYSNPLSYGSHLAGLLYQGQGGIKEYALLACICLIWFGLGLGFYRKYFSKRQRFRWKY